MTKIGFREPRTLSMVWFGVTVLIGSDISSCKAEPDVVFQGLRSSDAQPMLDSGTDGSVSAIDGSVSAIDGSSSEPTIFPFTCVDDSQLWAKEDVCEINAINRVYERKIFNSKDSCPSIYSSFAYKESDTVPDDQTTQCPQICTLIKNRNQGIFWILLLSRYYYYDDPSNPTKLIACPLLCEWLRGCWELNASETAQPSIDAAI
jgi:hypothetical protein